MAEYRVPTQQELDRLLYMQGMQGKSNQQIIDENLARGSTIQALPENFFQTASAGARRVGNYVNQAGNLQQIVNKLFPSNIGNTQANVQIPTSFNFAPKQAPTGEVLPAGLQTQSVPVANILKAIKPADVLGISGAERAYGDIGAGKAPQPFDVVDTLGVGAMGLGATSGLLKATKGLPVGMSIQEAKGLLQVAPKSDIGFYSAVEQAAMASPRKSATGQAFLNDIMKGQDVRADEIKWMGLDDYLKGKQNVTKQEVQDYIANNRVNVQEVTLSDTGLRKKFSVNSPEDQDLYDVVDKNNKVVFTGNIDDADYFIDRSLTKFSQYTLPGGKNYRELILTMPSKNPELSPNDFNRLSELKSKNRSEAENIEYQALNSIYEAKQRGETSVPYRSSHFPEQENPLAHIRVNDRIDADGKKMLLIEEIQSDWHQAGRDKGYAGQVKSAKDLENELTEINRERSKLLQYAADLPDSKMAEFKQVNTKIKELEEKARNVDSQIYQAVDRGDPVPDAPFKDTWYQLVLKRAIQHAAENGYDRIGLTTGKQQITRYSNELRQNVDEITFMPIGTKGEILVSAKKNNDKTFSGTVVNGKFIDGAAEGKTVEEVLGKAMAKQIIEKKDGVIKGDDLTIGGEGMKQYYDKSYPEFLNKYGKKWGAKVGETKIRTQSDKQALEDLDLLEQLGQDRSKFSSSGMTGVRYLDITPEMKAGVSKGQPLFAAVPAIPAAGLLAPQEQKRR